jgi:hypothetical protein
MGLHQIKRLLQKKGNDYQNQENTYKMEENLCQLLGKGLISRIDKDLKK